MRRLLLFAALVLSSSLLFTACSKTCSGKDDKDNEMKCAAAAECAVGQGHLTSNGSCEADGEVCCVPASACPEETFLCCATGEQKRPNCDDGVLVCDEDSVRCP